MIPSWIMDSDENDKSQSKTLQIFVLCLLSLKIQLSIVIHRPPDKSVRNKINFLISQPKHMLWVLKWTVSMRRFFWAPKTHV